MANVQMIHMVDDGFTHESRVYLRGQQLEVDFDKYPHFQYTPDEQIIEFGRVFYKPGPWDGALHDTSDPALTLDQRKKLERANAEILAARRKAEEGSELLATEQRRSRTKTTAATTE